MIFKTFHKPLVLVLLLFSAGLVFGQQTSETPTLNSSEILVQKAVDADHYFFDSKINSPGFEEKVNAAKITGLISFEINSSGKAELILEKNISTKNLDHVFNALGYSTYSLKNQ